jgi:hypothetical protein
MEDCNFEAGVPDRNFYCAPNECVPADSIPASLPTWDDSPYGNATPANDPALKVNAVDHYFNMAPPAFGLTYEIFVVNEVFTLTSTYLYPPSPTVAARQAETSVPGACYPWCNNCMLEAQAEGKRPALCVPGSAYEVSLGQCQTCIDAHQGDGAGSFVEIAPQFEQFLDYCAQFSTVVVSTSVTATTTNSVGSTSVVVSSTESATVVPTTSSAPSSSVGPATSVTTVVASTSTVTPTPTPYPTTATIATTSYTLGTVTGPSAWSQITLVLPWGANSTTTIYGSTLASGAATLILPEAAHVGSQVTVMTLTPGSPLPSILSTTPTATSTTVGTGASTTTTAPVATFTGAASSLQASYSNWPTLLGLILPFALALAPSL